MGIKLTIQIPCFNEQDALRDTLCDLPRSIEGLDVIDVLIIDDGSTDKTVEVARLAGVDYILSLKGHRGLAVAFAVGLDRCLSEGADIVVNIDADNQYKGEDIPRLIAPILRGEADIVIGNRDIPAIKHFSPLKKFLQRFGSAVVKFLSGLDIPDATTGFRAYSKKAVDLLEVKTTFSYTLETIIDAGRKGLRVANIQVSTNPPLRPSRLARSDAEYILKQVLTLFQVIINTFKIKLKKLFF